MKGITAFLLCFSLIAAGAGFSVSAGCEGSYVKMTGIMEAVHALFHKSEIVSTKYIGEESAQRWCAQDEYSLDDTAVVIKDRSRDFVILNITDIHFADYDVRALMAFRAISTVKKLVRQIRPDLITVTGDIVCSESAVYSIKLFTDMMNSFGIPWAPVFGNHENDGNCDLNFLADIMMKSPYCLLKKGDPSMGVGNYVVNIAEKDENGSLNVVNSLIMMDTHETHLNEKQIEWYKWAAEGISKACEKPIENNVFFHIPLAEYQYAYDEAWDAENGRWRVGYNASGELNEKICCYRDENGVPVNNGFFASAKGLGTTKNIFCGHEHMNDFSLVYQGIRLTYTLKVGKASGYQFGFNGGTVITIGSGGLETIKHEFVVLGMIKCLTLTDGD